MEVYRPEELEQGLVVRHHRSGRPRRVPPASRGCRTQVVGALRYRVIAYPAGGTLGTTEAYQQEVIL
jgi:hypothetical protein